MIILDPVDKLAIDFLAACTANDQNPGYNGRLIDIITDEHIKQAIVAYFSECDEWSNDLLPVAFEAYQTTTRVERMVRAVAGSVPWTIGA